MNRAARFITIAIVLALALVLGYRTLASRYLEPRAALLAQIESARSRLDRQREARTDAPRVAAELKNIVDRTLGGDLETVDHKLRTRLNRLRERVGLDGTSNTGVSSRRASPARTAFKTTAAQRSLREELDFIELAGFVNGQGTFEQALALITSIESEPWIKRIDELRLDPSDNGARFNISVRLTTLFLPDRAPDSTATIAATEINPARYASFAGVNPFRIPPPPAPAAQPEQPPVQVAQPPVFDYGQWRVTGVAQSSAGSEVWLLNTQTQQSMQLVVGQSIHDAALLAVHVDSAEFQIGDQRFAVQIGRNLGDRSPVVQ